MVDNESYLFLKLRDEQRHLEASISKLQLQVRVAILLTTVALAGVLALIICR